MERIQSAIAKARAARAEQADPPTRPAAQAAVPDAAPAAAEALETAALAAPALGDLARIAKAWAALPEFTPSATLMARNHIVTFTGGREAVTFDMMRTRLRQLMRANGWRRVAITSPGPSCGKSTIALNLGFSLGRQPDLRTMVLELDFRRPSMARILGMKARYNFAGVLEGTEKFEDHVIRHGANLAFATNHRAFPNPAELLHSARIGSILAEIEARYEPDVLIFDTPPMLATDDTMAFMPHVDCALIVAAAESTSIKEIDTCERELASQTNVLGVALNKCRYMPPDQGYGYYD